VAASLRIILSDPKVKAILVNVFGGITRCDVVAKGIISAASEVDVKVPMVIRLIGTNEEEGRQILKKSKFISAETLVEAAQYAVKAAQGSD